MTNRSAQTAAAAVPLLLALAVAAVAVFGQVQQTSEIGCVPVDLDPFPHSFKYLAMAEGSNWYLSNFGRPSQGVHLFNITNPSAALIPLNSSVLIWQPPCVTVTATVNGVPNIGLNSVPAYGKSLAVASDWGAVGAPNKDQSYRGLNSVSYAYSSIDVVNLYQLALTTNFPSNVVTIVDYGTPNLGLVMAFSEDATTLVSSYNKSHVVAYANVNARAGPLSTFGAPGDAFLALPSHFNVESMQMRGGLLAVAGVHFDPYTAFCFPSVALYTYNGASWTSAILVPLTRPSPGSKAPNYLPPVSTSTIGNKHAANNVWSNMACGSVASGGPSNAVSVDISTFTPPGQSTRNLVIGVPSQTCTYLSSYQNLTASHGPLMYVQCLNATSTSPSGQSVGWNAPDGTRFSVTSDTEVQLFDVNDFIARGLAGFNFAVPNRLMLTTGGTRPIRQSATTSAGMIALLVTDLQQPDTELFPATILPPGELFSYNKYTTKPCPTGRYKAGRDFQPCLYCPPGTYYDRTGATACISCTEEGKNRVGEEEEAPYCPTGSIYPYDPKSLEPPEEGPIPDFDADEFKEVFEDLLIATLFSLVNARYPVVALFLAFTGLCLLFAVLSTCGNCFTRCRPIAKKSRAALALLARLRHIVEGKFHSKKEKAKRAKKEREEREEEERLHGGGSGIPHPKKHKSAEEEEEAEGGITKSAEFEGYTTVVFALFSLSAIFFTIKYVNDYNPDSEDGPKLQNIFRSQSTIYRGQQVQEYQASLDGILHHGFNITIELIGMAGTSTCDAGHMALNFTFDGCDLPGRNGGCNLPPYVQYKNNSNLPNTCVTTLALPQGTSLLDASQLALKIPSYVSFQALRLNFSQSSGDIDLAAWALTHESKEPYLDNTAKINSVVFSETLLFPNASADAYLQSSIGREWVITPVAFRSQQPGQWDDKFDSHWYTQIVSTLPAILPVTDLNNYLYVDEADGITISINLQINLYFTQYLSQRLVGENEVILTILLAIIAIFHVTEMAEKIVVVTLSFFVPLFIKCYDDYINRDSGERDEEDDREAARHEPLTPHSLGGHSRTGSGGVSASPGTHYSELPAHPQIGPGHPSGGGTATKRSARELQPLTPEHDAVSALAMNAALNPRHANQPLLAADGATTHFAAK